MGKKIRQDLSMVMVTLTGSPAAVKVMEDLIDQDQVFLEALTTEIAAAAHRVVANHGGMGKKTYEISVSSGKSFPPTEMLRHARERARRANDATAKRPRVSTE